MNVPLMYKQTKTITINKNLAVVKILEKHQTGLNILICTVYSVPFLRSSVYEIRRYGTSVTLNYRARQ